MVLGMLLFRTCNHFLFKDSIVIVKMPLINIITTKQGCVWTTQPLVRLGKSLRRLATGNNEFLKVPQAFLVNSITVVRLRPVHCALKLKACLLWEFTDETGEREEHLESQNTNMEYNSIWFERKGEFVEMLKLSFMFGSDYLALWVEIWNR